MEGGSELAADRNLNDLWDLIMIDDGAFQGFSLVNPEGDVYYEKRITLELSPGYSSLLQEGAELLEAAKFNRERLEETARRGGRMYP